MDIKEEIRKYLASDEYFRKPGNGTEIIAEHFYNAALKEIRAIVLKEMRANDNAVEFLTNDGCKDTADIYKGCASEDRKIIRMIDELTGEE